MYSIAQTSETGQYSIFEELLVHSLVESFCLLRVSNKMTISSTHTGNIRMTGQVNCLNLLRKERFSALRYFVVAPIWLSTFNQRYREGLSDAGWILFRSVAGSRLLKLRMMSHVCRPMLHSCDVITCELTCDLQHIPKYTPTNGFPINHSNSSATRNPRFHNSSV